MPSHNKRSMEKRVAGKEKKAARHGQGPRAFHKKSSNSHHRHHGGSNNNNNNNHHRGEGVTRHTYNPEHPLDQQLFDYIIVVDIEATCEENHNHYPHEIIELPAVLIDVRRGLVDRARSFRTHVRPTRHPRLTPFCTQLTGITQADVDAAPTIKEALALFEKWYFETIPRGAKVAFATDGPWDFKNFIYEHHVLRDQIGFPTIFYEYLDIRSTFGRAYGAHHTRRLGDMLRHLRLQFVGRPHCGFDDAYNIARLAVAMMRAGCVFDYLVSLPLDGDQVHYTLEGVPLYRRLEGSGTLDRDVVDDIAKRTYGEDFFRFGERHRQEVLEYRRAHPEGFAPGGVATATAAAAGRWRAFVSAWAKSVALVVLSVVLAVMIWALVERKKTAAAAAADSASLVPPPTPATAAAVVANVTEQ